MRSKLYHHLMLLGKGTLCFGHVLNSYLSIIHLGGYDDDFLSLIDGYGYVILIIYLINIILMILPFRQKSLVAIKSVIRQLGLKS